MGRCHQRPQDQGRECPVPLCVAPADNACATDLQKEFPPEDTFPESQLIKMGKKAIQLIGIKDEEFYDGMGVYFMELTYKIGYGMLLKHLGRYHDSSGLVSSTCYD